MTTGGSDKDALDRAAYAAAERGFAELRRDLPEDALVALAREVVDRLAERHGGALEFPSTAAVDLLCRALLSEDPDLAMEMVQEAHRSGATVEALYLGYLAAAARRLGEWWTEDKVSFLDVTTGVSRIYAILRSLRPLLVVPDGPPTEHAVFAPVPNETHTLGITMVTDLFRKAGWLIDLKVGRSHEELVAEIESSDTQIIGLSAAGAHAVVPLARLVVALRVTNPAACIVVGGNILETNPDIVTRVGADGMARTVAETKAVVDAYFGG